MYNSIPIINPIFVPSGLPGPPGPQGPPGPIGPSGQLINFDIIYQKIGSRINKYIEKQIDSKKSLVITELRQIIKDTVNENIKQELKKYADPNQIKKECREINQILREEFEKLKKMAHEINGNFQTDLKKINTLHAQQNQQNQQTQQNINELRTTLGTIVNLLKETSKLNVDILHLTAEELQLQDTIKSSKPTAKDKDKLLKLKDLLAAKSSVLYEKVDELSRINI